MTVPSDATTPEELAEQWEAEKPPAAGPLANVAAAVVVVAVGISTAVAATRLGLGSPSAPGAGMWPFIIGCFLTITGAILGVTANRYHDAQKFLSTSWLVVIGLATMIAFAMLVATIGFEIPGALLAFVWLKFLGGESWRTSVVGAVLMVAAFYLIFVIGLGTPIPHLF